MSRRYPMGHSQRKEPSVLMHWPLIQGSLMHSSISAIITKNTSTTSKLHCKTITEKQGSEGSVLMTHVPFGWSGPCWYPSLGQRRTKPSATKRCEESHRPFNNVSVSLHMCVLCACLCDGTSPYLLPCWGRFHRGLPSLDLACRCSSTLPWKCSEALEPGSARCQTWYSSSSHGYLKVNIHKHTPRGQNWWKMAARQWGRGERESDRCKEQCPPNQCCWLRHLYLLLKG